MHIATTSLLRRCRNMSFQSGVYVHTATQSPAGASSVFEPLVWQRFHLSTADISQKGENFFLERRARGAMFWLLAAGQWPVARAAGICSRFIGWPQSASTHCVPRQAQASWPLQLSYVHTHVYAYARRSRPAPWPNRFLFVSVERSHRFEHKYIRHMYEYIHTPHGPFPPY